MQPTQQTQTDKHVNLSQLVAYRTAFDAAAKKAPNRPIKQNATYEQLRQAWCAQSLAAAGIRPRLPVFRDCAAAGGGPHRLVRQLGTARSLAGGPPGRRERMPHASLAFFALDSESQRGGT